MGKHEIYWHRGGSEDGGTSVHSADSEETDPKFSLLLKEAGVNLGYTDCCV